MKAVEINDFINKVKNIPAIAGLFWYIGYELPKTNKNTPSLTIIDLDDSYWCIPAYLMEFRIIWGLEEPQIKIKSYSDIIDENILWNKVGTLNIQPFDYNAPILNGANRFELIKTYQVF